MTDLVVRRLRDATQVYEAFRDRRRRRAATSDTFHANSGCGRGLIRLPCNTTFRSEPATEAALLQAAAMVMTYMGSKGDSPPA